MISLTGIRFEISAAEKEIKQNKANETKKREEHVKNPKIPTS